MVVDDIHVLIVILAGDSNGLASHTLSSMQEFLPMGRKEKNKKNKKKKKAGSGLWYTFLVYTGAV